MITVDRLGDFSLWDSVNFIAINNRYNSKSEISLWITDNKVLKNLWS